MLRSRNKIEEAEPRSHVHGIILSAVERGSREILGSHANNQHKDVGLGRTRNELLALGG